MNTPDRTGGPVGLCTVCGRPEYSHMRGDFNRPLTLRPSSPGILERGPRTVAVKHSAAYFEREMKAWRLRAFFLVAMVMWLFMALMVVLYG